MLWLAGELLKLGLEWKDICLITAARLSDSEDIKKQMTLYRFKDPLISKLFVMVPTHCAWHDNVGKILPSQLQDAEAAIRGIETTFAISHCRIITAEPDKEI